MDADAKPALKWSLRDVVDGIRDATGVKFGSSVIVELTLRLFVREGVLCIGGVDAPLSFSFENVLFILDRCLNEPLDLRLIDNSDSTLLDAGTSRRGGSSFGSKSCSNSSSSSASATCFSS